MSVYRELKRQCFESNLLLPGFGLIDLTFGNVSVLDRAKGVFAIKPSGVKYDTLEADEMVVVDLEGRQIEGRLRPSSDTPTHRRLYREFSSAAGIVHTHSRSATVFAQAGKAIPCLGTTHADYFHGEIPVTRAMTSTELEGEYEWETGSVIAETFSTGDLDPSRMPAILVRGHGPFAWGPNGSKAVENAQALEIVAEMALRTLSLNSDIQPISRQLLDRHFLRKHGARSYYGQPEQGAKEL